VGVEYSGPEQRAVTELSALTSSINDLRAKISGLTSAHRTMAANFGCLKTQVEKYKPMLDRAEKKEALDDDFRHSVKKAAVIALVLSAIGGITAACLFWLRHNIGGSS